jgi:probable rRNA maturation factor
VIERESRQQGKPAADHWAHLVVHGCLHLLGFDHERAADALRMERRERQILSRFHIPDPYLIESNRSRQR